MLNYLRDGLSLGIIALLGDLVTGQLIAFSFIVNFFLNNSHSIYLSLIGAMIRRNFNDERSLRILFIYYLENLPIGAAIYEIGDLVPIIYYCSDDALFYQHYLESFDDDV